MAICSILVLTCRPEVSLSNCLSAVAKETADLPVDVLVLGNGISISPIVKERFRQFRFFEMSVNLGFGAGNNFLARQACKGNLIFLNDDARPEKGWLRALLAAAKHFPDAGAIGSQIYFESGRLQEAGSVVWRDGSTDPVGRYGKPMRSAVHSVHYSSANGLLVMRDAWDAVGGFNETYHPAYYEDVDLCFAIRHRLSREILVQPAARIVHNESQSSNPRFREYLMRSNRAMFVRQWDEYLSQYPSRSEVGSVTSAASYGFQSRSRLLIVDDRFPDAGIGSGFGRLAEVIHETRLDYLTSFFATNELPRSIPSLQDRGVEIIRDLRISLRNSTYDVVLISRPHNYAAVAPLVRRFQPKARIIYDAESLFFRRLPSGKNRDAQERVERDIMRTADAVVSVSDVEAKWIRAAGARNVTLKIPMPAVVVGDATFAERHEVIFVAGWLAGSASPNLAALEWFARDVLPHVTGMLPGVRILVTGANPPSEALACANDAIEFVGFVHDLDAFYNRARVAIAPILQGAGAKIKVVEALFAGVPIVTTPVGADGLDCRDGGAAINDDAEAFARGIAELYRDEALWSSHRAKAIEYAEKVRENKISWNAVVAETLRLLAARTS